MAKDWSSIPEEQHIPVMESMFNLAIKSIGRCGLGKTFKDDKDVRKFGDAYTTVSIRNEIFKSIIIINKCLFDDYITYSTHILLTSKHAA